MEPNLALLLQLNISSLLHFLQLMLVLIWLISQRMHSQVYSLLYFVDLYWDSQFGICLMILLLLQTSIFMVGSVFSWVSIGSWFVSPHHHNLNQDDSSSSFLHLVKPWNMVWNLHILLIKALPHNLQNLADVLSYCSDLFC